MNTRFIVLLAALSLSLGSCTTTPSTAQDPLVLNEVQPILVTAQKLLEREVVGVRTKAPVQLATEDEILSDFALLKTAVEVTLPAADPLQGICTRRIDQLRRDRAMQLSGQNERAHAADVQLYQDLAAVQQAVGRVQGILAPAHVPQPAAPQPVAQPAPNPETESVAQGTPVEAMETAPAAPPAPVAAPKPTDDLPPVNPRK